MTAWLEIAELANGDVVLRRAGGEGDPLVKIRFSAESRTVLAEGKLSVARAMIEAGIHAAASISGGEAELDFLVDDNETADIEAPEPILH